MTWKPTERFGTGSRTAAAAGAFAAVTVALALALAGCAPKNSMEGATPSEEVTSATAGGTTTGGAPAPPPGPPAAGASAFPGTDAGAKDLLAQFVKPGADHGALTSALRPTKADLEAIFDADLAAKADAAYGPAWDGGQMVVAPKAGQTEVKVFSATSDELKGGTGAASEFPGGWKDVAGKLKPGLQVYRFKFVEPGKDLGMAFDGLVYVNGNWRIVPKPWKAM